MLPLDLGTRKLGMEHRMDSTFKEFIRQSKHIVGLVPIARNDFIWSNVFWHEILRA
jgi:hypothetical protein